MRIIAIIFITLLSACSATKGYRPQPWAKMTYQQAYAYCDYQLQQMPWTTIESCMQAQGWQPVY